MNMFKQKSQAFRRGLLGRAKHDSSPTYGGDSEKPHGSSAAVPVDADDEVRKAVAGCIEEQSTLRVSEQARLIADRCSVPAGPIAEDLMSAGLGARVSMEVGPTDELMRRDAEIRVRAYEIWQRGGCTGNAEDHWYAAQRELTLEGKFSPSKGR
jgi:Protein of unknown function (DUF2934)